MAVLTSRVAVMDVAVRLGGIGDPEKVLPRLRVQLNNDFFQIENEDDMAFEIDEPRKGIVGVFVYVLVRLLHIRPAQSVDPGDAGDHKGCRYLIELGDDQLLRIGFDLFLFKVTGQSHDRDDLIPIFEMERAPYGGMRAHWRTHDLFRNAGYFEHLGHIDAIVCSVDSIILLEINVKNHDLHLIGAHFGKSQMLLVAHTLPRSSEVNRVAM